MDESMNLNEYQETAASTAIYPEDSNIIYPVLGLNGEAGEVAEKVKKVIRDNNGIFSEEVITEIAKELGDVLWYLAAIARDLDLTLEDIARGNLIKLKQRQDRNKLNGSGDNR